MVLEKKLVIPAKAGIQKHRKALDVRVRGHDEEIKVQRATRLAICLSVAAALATSAAFGETRGAAPKPERPSLTLGGKAADQTGNRYRVRSAPHDELVLAPPSLPDLTPYTAQNIAAKIKKTPAGRAEIRRMVETRALHEFVGGGEGRLTEWAARQSSHPRAIFIEGGYLTPRDLARKVPKEFFEETAPGIFVLRLPLVIMQGATFHIDGATKDFRMSQERGAFLVNDSKLFITDSKLSAWSERKKALAPLAGPSDFRPYLISWGGTETYISGSVISNLGYAASKAYGVSISQYSPGIVKEMNRKPPTGWIVNSEFIGNWYGFYCYETEDFVLVGNTYRDNIVYGIDPHDRSRRLIIANNTATGIQQKHGIIVSREVNDSWIFGNRAFRNKLSGIVIDRSSVNNVVAYNESHNNGTDGFTIYESPNNLLWGNRAIGNGRHGIRLRNSVDIRLYDNVAVANKLSGVYGHIKDLRGTDRDMKLDPFETNVSMVIVGGQLIYNGSTPINIDRPLSVELYNVELLAPTKKGGIQMTGVLGELQLKILEILVKQKAAAIIEPIDGVPKREPQKRAAAR